MPKGNWPKRPYTLADIAKMNEELQRYNAKLPSFNPTVHTDKFKTGFKRGKGRANGVPLFASQTPEVRERALIKLEALLIKHKDKLATKPKRQYYSLLCGVAVHMAKCELGLVMSYKDMQRRYHYRKLRRLALMTRLGLKGYARRSKRPPVKDAPKLQVTHTNLDGI